MGSEVGNSLIRSPALMVNIKPKSVIRLLRANEPSFCHLFRYFSVTMEPHCALKVAKHLFELYSTFSRQG